MSGMVLPLIAGATCYALGWIYLPDLPFFRRWVDRRREAAKRAEELQKVAAFVQRRDALLASLSPVRRERYTRLAAVCRDIETASADNLLASADPATDPRLRKLDELMWTYLRLLGIEESLERFLETERQREPAGPVEGGRSRSRAPERRSGGPQSQGQQRRRWTPSNATWARAWSGWKSCANASSAASRPRPTSPWSSPNRNASTSRSSSSAPTPSPPRTPRPSPPASTPPSSTWTRPTNGSPRWMSSRTWSATCPPRNCRVGYEAAATSASPSARRIEAAGRAA